GRLAYDFEVFARAEDRLLIDEPRDLLPFGQLAVRDLLSAAGDRAVFGDELLARHAELLRGQFHQHRPGLGRRRADRRAEHARRLRAPRALVPRTEIGVAHDHG